MINQNKLRASMTTQKCLQPQRKTASIKLNIATIALFPLSPANTKYPLSKDIRQYFSSISLHHKTTEIAIEPVKAADKKRLTMGDM
jgi:hypothetical protein